jgi:hypothetical protein
MILEPENVKVTFFDDSKLSSGLNVARGVGGHALVDPRVELHETQDLQVRTANNL